MNQYPKPYLGGFRNVKNGKVYHNAFGQTDQKKTEHKTKFHRVTQTYTYETRSTKVMREFGTQMERRFLWIDKRNDKKMEPRVYFTKEMWDARREEAALFI